EVTALCGQGSYLGGERLPAREDHKGVQIRRIQSTSLGKRTLAHRAFDYGSFYARAALALALLPRQDALIAMTTPPLIAAVGLGPQKLRRTRLIYWCQDLHPDVAVAFGVLGKRSPAAVSLGLASRTVLSQSDRIVV